MCVCVCVCYFIDLSFLIKRLDLESLEAVSGTKLTVSLHSLPVDSNSIPNPYLSLSFYSEWSIPCSILNQEKKECSGLKFCRG